MPRVPARPLLRDAAAARFALPAFNVANMETLQGVLRAAEECGSPVIIQVSPGAIAYAGYETITELVFREADRSAAQAIVHLDHCRDVDVVRRAVADGYDSVMFDGSRLELGENVVRTADVVAMATQRGIAVEGEIGYIGGSEDANAEEARAAATSPQEAAAFVSATGVDVLAPAIGTLHRMPDDSVDLDIGLIRRIAQATGVPLALHGGSGVTRSQLAGSLDAGIGKVNISSRVSRSMAAGIRECWATDGPDVDLRRFLGAGRTQVTDLAREYMLLCRSAGRVTGGGGGAAADDTPEEAE